MALYSRQFFHGLNKKYIAAFGQLFADLDVLRFNTSGVEVSRERVPIDYGPKEKWFRGQNEDPEFQRFIANKLPRMSWELVSWNFDAFRAQNNTLQFTNRQMTYSDGNTQRFYTPIPYDLTFSLHIITKSIDDMHQIMEQIVPAFKPDVTLRMEIIKSMNYEMDVPINLLSIQSQDTYTGKLQELRIIETTMTFVLHGWFVGPVGVGKPIKKTVLNLINQTTNERLESHGTAPFAEGRATITDVLSTDEYEFLRASGYFETNAAVIANLEDQFEARATP
jgi:T4-like virus Myoviridae tail sheath stabiliser